MIVVDSNVLAFLSVEKPPAKKKIEPTKTEAVHHKINSSRWRKGIDTFRSRGATAGLPLRAPEPVHNRAPCQLPGPRARVAWTYLGKRAVAKRQAGVLGILRHMSAAPIRFSLKAWCNAQVVAGEFGYIEINGALTKPTGDPRAVNHQTLLSVQDVGVRFGGIVALDAVSFDVSAGIVCGLIGPNGAGKTTLFNCLSRLYQPASGDILFEGQSLLKRPVHAIAGLGIGRTFQNLAMFRSLSVRSNVMVGAHSASHAGFLTSALRLPGVRAEEARLAADADRVLDLLDLTGVADHPAGDLPFGIQKRVELGRALASKPKLLLLDEPAAGLNHQELDGLASLIKSLRDQLKLTVLLVEHHMSLVMAVSDHIVALNFGRKIAEGTPAAIQAHPEVIAAYLGAPRKHEAANAQTA